ncbi:MAG: metalloregulator ArsR/SmtB family transcription factor [Moraxellaceae bacterium]|nr:metalloregulator ArsR/SmtB family transcription factor [Moraxellaceae bacterium]MDZ4385914.1 metalloregulator ArsR/SmtB family transcription factor [Moraxellaceae bacterium]
MTPAQLFKCLADATRLHLMLMITREQELCVCELTCALEASQPKISRHLAMLRQCGLLADRRQGQWVYYRLHPNLPLWARTVLDAALTAEQLDLAQHSQRLDAMPERPQRINCC